MDNTMEFHLILVFISTVLVTAVLGQGVYLELPGGVIPNNSVVSYFDIGTGSSTLRCVTQRVDCCSADNITTADWFTPSGEVADTQFIRTWRGLGSEEGYVRIHRLSSTIPASVQEGLYHCNIPAPNGDISTLYVGIYTSDIDGRPTISGITYCQLSPEMFTLTCTSTGGPATTVTWTLNGSEITYDANHVLTQTVVNTRTAEYKNTLTVTGREAGNYQCTVSNARLRRGTSQQLLVMNFIDVCTPLSTTTVYQPASSSMVMSSLVTPTPYPPTPTDMSMIQACTSVLVGSVIAAVLLVVIVVLSVVIVLLVLRLHHLSSSLQRNPGVEMLSGPGAISVEECVAYGPHKRVGGGGGGEGGAIYSEPAYEMGVTSEQPVVGNMGLSSTTEETVYERLD